MSVETALSNLKKILKENEHGSPILFNDFINSAAENPNNVFRNIFQLFSDFIKYYIGEGNDEYPNDPDSINYIKYDSSRLFVEDSDMPFFADRPFANRLVNLAKSFRESTHQNRIYIFEGPTGSGKSTFLNNILAKFEKYTNSSEGLTYEIFWRIDRKKVGGFRKSDILSTTLLADRKKTESFLEDDMQDDLQQFLSSVNYVEVPCPSHDNPILIIPKKYRKDFIDQIITDKKIKNKIFNRKEYEWIFKDELCTICSSLYQTLLEKIDSPDDLFNMVFVRKYYFNRRLGEGISVYNPGDRVRKYPLTNSVLQEILNNLLRDSNAVNYMFSSLARTNNGIFSIMDVKSHNKQRLMNLHGIISDNVHKVENIEESVRSLFIALMNPEDKDVVESVKSLGDRVLRIPISYVLDYTTEAEIYYNKFGKEIGIKFLPGVLENFAKTVISSRLNKKSKNLKEWIKDPKVYTKYCDKDLLLLKMDIYTGIIPSWLTEDDLKNFDSKTRRKLIDESKDEGQDENSITGRKSIEIFNEFYSKYSKNGSFIDMAKLYNFFSEKEEIYKKIPEGFLESLLTQYDYNLLQQIKKSLFSYNEKEISKEIMNYLFAINFELGSKAECNYTGMDLDITEEFLKKTEDKLGKDLNDFNRKNFRQDVQKEYISKTLSYEIGVENKTINDTSLYNYLLEKYKNSLKEDVLTPFLESDNFRNAIKDYGTSSFKSYDKKIIKDVKFTIKNLVEIYNYTEEGAKQVCIYVVDNEIPAKFTIK